MPTPKHPYSYRGVPLTRRMVQYLVYIGTGTHPLNKQIAEQLGMCEGSIKLIASNLRIRCRRAGYRAWDVADMVRFWYEGTKDERRQLEMLAADLALPGQGFMRDMGLLRRSMEWSLEGPQ